MATTLTQGLMELGVATPLAREIGRQVTTGSYSWQRLMWSSMEPDLARYTASSLQSGAFSAVQAVKLGMVPAVASLVATAYVPNRAYPSFPENLLADLSRVAFLNNSGSLAVTDVTSDGVLAVRHLPPASDQRLGPISPLASPLAIATKDSIVVTMRPIANADGSSPAMGRISMEIISGASMGQATDMQQAAIGSAPSDVRLRSTAQGPAIPGKMQQYSNVVAQLSTIGGGANLSAITAARMLDRGPAGANQSWDFVKIVHRPNPRTKTPVIIAFDDAPSDQYTTARPLMQAAGLPMSIFGGAYLANIGQPGFLTVSQLQEIRAGWAGKRGQICGQAGTTENPAGAGMNVAALATDLDNMLAWGRANGFDDDMLDGSYFSTVGPANMTYADAFVNGRFRTVRCFFPGNALQPPMNFGESWPVGDPLRVRALDAATRSLAEVTAHLDQANASNSLAVVVYHGASYANGYATLPGVIAWCQANTATAEVGTMRDFLFG